MKKRDQCYEVYLGDLQYGFEHIERCIHGCDVEDKPNRNGVGIERTAGVIHAILRLPIQIVEHNGILRIDRVAELATTMADLALGGRKARLVGVQQLGAPGCLERRLPQPKCTGFGNSLRQQEWTSILRT